MADKNANPKKNVKEPAKKVEDEVKNDEFQMEYRMMGGTGLKISVLGFGTMSLDELEQTKNLISVCRKHGVNFFDNAELYGQPCGNGEILFGKALKELEKKDPNLYRRSDLVITTKLYFGVSDGKKPNMYDRSFGPNDLGTSRKHIMEGMDQSLKRLQLDYVDVIYAHQFDPLTPMLETVRGFTDIIRSGKAFYWGTSHWSTQKQTEAYWIAKINKLIPPVVDQPKYNMFFRDDIEKNLLPMFEHPYCMGTTTWSPLDCGILTGKYVKEIPKESRLGGANRLGKWWGNANYVKKEKNEKVAKMMIVAKELKVSMVSLALGWIIKHKNVSCCLLGGTKPHQLEQNMAAIATAKKITPEIMERLDKILDNNPGGGGSFLVRKVKNITNPF